MNLAFVKNCKHCDGTGFTRHGFTELRQIGEEKKWVSVEREIIRHGLKIVSTQEPCKNKNHYIIGQSETVA